MLKKIGNYKLNCPIIKGEKTLFFSLVDYRNSLFTSKDPKEIIEFYNGFENRDQLLHWMKLRPKGIHTLKEIEGSKEVVVVIPTADFNGAYARECRELIFKGLQMIFVESGGREDSYFNYAHNCNVGIGKALEYDPRWVVITNDDMEKIDDISSLIKQLRLLDNNEQIVFASKGEGIVAEWKIGRLNLMGKIASLVIPKKSGLAYYAEILKLRKKFNIKYVTVNSKFTFRMWKEIFYNRTNEKFRISGVFNVVSAEYLKQLSPIFFDATFINGSEDADFYLNACRTGVMTGNIEFRIRNLMSKTLGNGKDRNLREISNHSYLCFKRFKG